MSDSSFKDMIDIVYERVLAEMKEHDIPDTTDNRILFLRGLREGWMESAGDDPDAQSWITAVSFEIFSLTLQRMREHLATLN